MNRRKKSNQGHRHLRGESLEAVLAGLIIRLVGRATARRTKGSGAR